GGLAPGVVGSVGRPPNRVPEYRAAECGDAGEERDATYAHGYVSMELRGARYEDVAEQEEHWNPGEALVAVDDEVAEDADQRGDGGKNQERCPLWQRAPGECDQQARANRDIDGAPEDA